MASEIVNNVSRWGGGDFCVDNFEIDWLMGYLGSDQENKKKMIDSDVGNNNLEKSKTSNSESLCACDLDIDSIMGYLDSDQENKKKMIDSDAGNNNLEKSRTSNSESLFACDLDIDSIMGYLDLDQENSNKMNLEGTGCLIDSGFNLEESRTSTRGSFIVMDSGVADCSAAHQCEIGGFCFDDLCSDDFDINWFVRCLDSDKQEEPLKDNTVNKVVRRKFAIGDQKLDEFGGGLCLDDLSGGDLCFNDHLDGKDLCSDDFDIDLFMRCLDSDKEDEPVKDNTLDSDKEDEPVKDNTFSKVVRRKFKISNQELDEFDGVFCLDDLCVGDLCVDEDSDFGIDWFVRWLDSDQKEDPVEDSTVDQLERREYEAEFGGDFCCDDLSGFDIDWFMQILDSNQEEPVEHRTSSNLGKRKFEAEVNQTGPKRRVVSNY